MSENKTLSWIELIIKILIAILKALANTMDNTSKTMGWLIKKLDIQSLCHRA